MKTTKKTTSKPETFKSLCKQLGQSVRANASTNALLCYRAYELYVEEHPETGHGKAKGTDTPSFRNAAAEEAGISPSTIDALLQVGKAIQGLPKTVQYTLVSSSLANAMRVLRKLATKEFEKKRATFIAEFAKNEEADSTKAMKTLKKKLGLSTSAKTPKNKAKSNSQPAISSGQSFEVAVDGQVFRVKGAIVDGHLQLTPMNETSQEKITQPVGKEPKPVTKKHGSKALTSAPKPVAHAA